MHDPRGWLRALLAPKRRWPLIPLLLVAMVGGYLLYPGYPDVSSTLSPLEAERAGRAVLGEILQAHGGLAAFRKVGLFSVEVDDQWSALFEGHAPWPGGSGAIETLFAPAGRGYKARFSFRDRTLWGFDGADPWAVAGRTADLGSPPDSARLAHAASIAMPRLFLMPFSIIQEQAEVAALHVVPDGQAGTDVLQVEFRPHQSGPSERWLIWADADSHRIQRMVFASGATRRGPIESCFVEARETVSGVLLGTWLTCYTASKLSIELHRVLFERIRAESLNDRAFLPPDVLGSVDDEGK